MQQNADSRLKCHVRRGTAFCQLEMYVEGREVFIYGTLAYTNLLRLDYKERFLCCSVQFILGPFCGCQPVLCNVDKAFCPRKRQDFYGLIPDQQCSDCKPDTHPTKHIVVNIGLLLKLSHTILGSFVSFSVLCCFYEQEKFTQL